MTAAQRKPLEQKAQIRTNTTRGSVCKIDMPAMKFSGLWGDYITGGPYRNAKTGDVPPGFGNQCAIRTSVTLHKVGIEMKLFMPTSMSAKPGYQFGRILMRGRYAAILTDQMGSWLSRRPFCGLRRAEDTTGRDWESKVRERTDIAVLDSYWSRSSDSASGASGGHIDLWNGSRSTISEPINSIATVSRMFGMDSLFPRSSFDSSDLGDSKKILFWEVR